MSGWVAGLGRGTQVPDHAVGRVHCVFEHACNIALHDDQSLSLLDSTCANAPLAIRLNVVGGMQRLFQPGEPFSIKAGVWRTRRCRGEFADLPVWEPVQVTAPLPVALIHLNLHRIDEELAAWKAMHPGDRAGSDLRELIGDLGDAVREREVHALGTSVRRLMGNGQGLTPSGDDIMIGGLAALWRLSCVDRSLGPLLSAFCTAVTHLLPRTTFVSRQYLGLAIRNLFVQPLDELRQRCLGCPDDTVLRESCQRVLRIGSSSGFDTLTGLVEISRAALALPETVMSGHSL